MTTQPIHKPTLTLKQRPAPPTSTGTPRLTLKSAHGRPTPCIHPTQHSTLPHCAPASAANALRQMTNNLRSLQEQRHVSIMRGMQIEPDSHKQVLAQAAQQSRSFQVRPAPMPGCETSTKEGA